MRVVVQWERILVIDWQWAARQLHACASRHQVFRLEKLQMRGVRRDAVVFGARCEFDVLCKQIQDSPKLIGSVIARGCRVTVVFGADPAWCFDRSAQRCREPGGFSGNHFDRLEAGVVLVTAADDDVVRAGRELRLEFAVGGVLYVLNTKALRIRPEVGIIHTISTKLNFRRNLATLVVCNAGHNVAWLG